MPMGRVLVFAVIAFLLVGCATSSNVRDWRQVTPTKGNDPVAETNLLSGDQLQLALTLPKSRTAESYRLRPGDEIRVDGITGEKAATSAKVAPDGTIALPLLGQVSVADKTLAQVSESLTQFYSHYIREPRIVAQPVRLGAEARELRQAYTSGGQTGPGLTVTIDPDGYIDLPLLGPTQAADQTPSDLSHELTSRYGQVVPGVQITVNVRQLVPRRVFVLGLVQKPGQVSLSGSPTLLQALAQVGGWRMGADLSNVTVYRRTSDDAQDIQRLVVGLDNLADGDVNRWPDVQLAANDVIVVPGNGAHHFNVWVEQTFVRGVWGILPFGGGVSVGP